MAAATAKYARQPLADFRLGWVRSRIEEELRVHDDSVHAEPALRSLLFDERLLQVVQILDAPAELTSRAVH